MKKTILKLSIVAIAAVGLVSLTSCSKKPTSGAGYGSDASQTYGVNGDTDSDGFKTALIVLLSAAFSVSAAVPLPDGVVFWPELWWCAERWGEILIGAPCLYLYFRRGEEDCWLALGASAPIGLTRAVADIRSPAVLALTQSLCVIAAGVMIGEILHRVRAD